MLDKYAVSLTNQNKEKSMKIDRREFLSPIPANCVNTKSSANSTLYCNDDVWGTKDEHYRYINDDSLPAREDGKSAKSLKLIGQPHFEWSDHYVKVRTDKNSYKWYKHWATAINLYHFGKLDEKEIGWVKEEGAKRFKMGLLPIVNIKGKLTLAATVLAKLGVLIIKGNKATLIDDSTLAAKTVAKSVDQTVQTDNKQKTLTTK